MEACDLRYKSFTQVKISARILKQAHRNQTIFSALPEEMLCQIATETRNPTTHTYDQAFKLACRFFSKPVISKPQISNHKGMLAPLFVAGKKMLGMR